MGNIYLVTGVGGFIGAKTAEELLSAGHAVIGVDNLNDAYDPRLKTWRLARLQSRPEFSFHQIDVNDQQSLQSLRDQLPQVSGIINLAARAGVRQSVENPRVYIDTNISGTLNLLNLCRDYGIKKFVLASTSSLYGLGNAMPYQEDARTDYPLSPYAASKKGAEALCYSYHSLYQLDITVFRYFTVYGPAGRPDMSVFRFIQWINEGRPVIIYGDGQQSRDFTYIDDIARGTIKGLDLTGYEIVNLGSDQPIVLLDIIRFIEQQLGKPAQLVYQPRRQADMIATWADITKARTLLGWQPETDYQQGVIKTIRWYLENRDWARDIRTDNG